MDHPENTHPPGQGTPLLELTGVGQSFGSLRVLDGIDFDLRPGEVHVLAGENGAGKSTLVKIIAGIHRDYEGSVRINGETRRFRNPAEATRAGVAVIHQELSLIGALSVHENLALGREGHGWWLDRRREDRCLREVCALLELPTAAAELNRSVESLPLGVRNRIEIAKALLGDARMLVMDEPTSALADSEVEILFRIIAGLKARGAGIIYISHKMEEIFRLADRITVLRDGHRVFTTAAARCTPPQLVESMIGRPIESFVPPRQQPPAAQALRFELRGFAIQRPGEERPGVAPLDLAIAAGEIVGLAGLPGSGCREVVLGIFERDGVNGTIMMEGKPIARPGPAAAIQAGIGLVTGDRQATGIVPDLSVQANVTLAVLPELSTGGFLRRHDERRRAEAGAKRVDVRMRSLAQPVATLSGGNQQKVVLAKWLETQPRLLLLDEPTRGVDIGAKYEIYLCLRQLAHDGLAILLTSTEMPELLGLCDRIIVLHRGQVAANFAAPEATPQRILAAAMGGRAA